MCVLGDPCLVLLCKKTLSWGAAFVWVRCVWAGRALAVVGVSLRRERKKAHRTAVCLRWAPSLRVPFPPTPTPPPSPLHALMADRLRVLRGHMGAGDDEGAGETERGGESQAAWLFVSSRCLGWAHPTRPPCRLRRCRRVDAVAVRVSGGGDWGAGGEKHASLEMKKRGVAPLPGWRQRPPSRPLTPTHSSSSLSIIQSHAPCPPPPPRPTPASPKPPRWPSSRPRCTTCLRWTTC